LILWSSFAGGCWVYSSKGVFETMNREKYIENSNIQTSHTTKQDISYVIETEQTPGNAEYGGIK
jgi:hypothetical protein